MRCIAIHVSNKQFFAMLSLSGARVHTAPVESLKKRTFKSPVFYIVHDNTALYIKDKI